MTQTIPGLTISSLSSGKVAVCSYGAVIQRMAGVKKYPFEQNRFNNPCWKGKSVCHAKRIYSERKNEK